MRTFLGSVVGILGAGRLGALAVPETGQPVRTRERLSVAADNRRRAEMFRHSADFLILFMTLIYRHGGKGGVGILRGEV